MDISGCNIAIFDDHNFRADSIILALNASGLAGRHIHFTFDFDRDHLASFVGASDRVLFLYVLGSGSIRRRAVIEGFRELRAVRPDALLVALVDEYSPEEIEAAIGIELDGVIPTSFSRAVVAAGLQFIIAGGRYFPHGGRPSAPERSEYPCGLAGAGCIDKPRRQPDMRDADGPLENAGDSPRLTARQLEVLEAVRQGQSNKVIARMLDISEATVKLHVRQLLRKFNASNRTQIAIRVPSMAEDLRN